MKRCIIVTVVMAVVLLSTIAVGFAYSYAVNARQTSQELGFDFTDHAFANDSFEVRVEFKKTFIDDFELASYVWLGFDDGTFNNYDTIQIKNDNGMATGVSGECWLTNSSGGFSGYSSTVQYGQTSTKVTSQHPSGSTVTYGCYLTY